MIITDINVLKQQSEYLTVDKARECGIFHVLEEELNASVTPGCGLAAIQVGKPLACFIMKIKGQVLRVLNPMIVDRSEPCIIPNEGCLSFPGRTVNTDRYMQITAQYEDYDTGKLCKSVFYGEEAIVFQHEYDHVAGITIFDREHHSISIGRNDPCPLCIAEGINIKYKKCKKHFK